MSGGYFGDRLQSIYGFDGGGGALDRPCDEHVEDTLQFGHRWRDDADSRGWHHGSRQALLAGEAIDLRNLPSCVRVHLWSGEPPGVSRKGHCLEVLTALQRLRLPARSTLLVSESAHARGLVERLGVGPATLYEGADVKEPCRCVELALEGDPARLA